MVSSVEHQVAAVESDEVRGSAAVKHRVAAVRSHEVRWLAAVSIE